MNDKLNPNSQRQAFELWITQSPYERDIARWLDDSRKHAWKGQYRDISVELAWDAWQESPKHPSAFGT